MAEFERGDVVVYMHPEAPSSGRGPVAIVERIQKTGAVDVQWISTNDYVFDEPQYTRRGWEPRSFEKVGHIDLPPEPQP